MLLGCAKILCRVGTEQLEGQLMLIRALFEEERL